MTQRRIDIVTVALSILIGAVLTLMLLARVAHAGTSPPDSLADDGWEAWRAGWVGLLVLVGLFALGVLLTQRRGYIAARWPALNRGRAWALLAIGMSVLVTLIPLAIGGDLGVDRLREAFQYQAPVALALWWQPDMGVTRQAAEERRARAADGGVPT